MAIAVRESARSYALIAADGAEGGPVPRLLVAETLQL